MSRKRRALPPRRYELSGAATAERPPLTMAAGAGFTPFEVLDELIEAGWGEIPQEKIPRGWRYLRPPGGHQPRSP